MLKPLHKWIRHSLLLPLTIGLAATAHAQTVTIGVQSMFAPWKNAIAEKEFEKATGWDIQWRNFDSGGDVMLAMASGDVQIGVAGSSRASPSRSNWRQVPSDSASTRASSARRARGRASNTTVSRPSSCSHRASVSPTGPAPTMATS